MIHRVRDRRLCHVPGALGDVVHSVFVRGRVESIFKYRKEALRKRFGVVGESGSRTPEVRN